MSDLSIVCDKVAFALRIRSVAASATRDELDYVMARPLMTLSLPW